VEIQSALTQTLYAQLLEEATAYSVAIFEQGLIGSPYINKAGGHQYVYWQVKLPDGNFKRTSLGRNSPETQVLVQQLLARRNSAEELTESLKASARAFVGSGGMVIDLSHFKVIESLARAGLFSKGVVLVGSHAFTSIGNTLGVRWGQSLKTTDMDFARPSGIALAIPDAGEHINVPAKVKEFDRTYFEVPQLNNKNPSTSLMSNKSKIKIDFLTVQRNGIDSKPHYFADLSIAAEPLKYMDYLLGGQSVMGLVVGSHAIPVNLPDPARFAVHKLVIAQERTLSFETKSAKDIRQATDVLEALIETDREHDIQQAIADLLAVPKALANVQKSMERMEGRAKEVLIGAIQNALLNGLAEAPNPEPSDPNIKSFDNEL
jgi:hypothetical protein